MKHGKINALIIFLLSLFLAGCNEVEMQSQWTDSITLETATEADWPEYPQYFDKDSRVGVSLMNDENYLYIRLLSRSQTTKMLFLRAGFTVWLDDTGNTRKTYGIQFPIAKQKQMQGHMADHKSRSGIEEMLEDSQYSLAILRGPGETRQTIPTSKATEMGIYAQLDMQQGYLIYELKVPFTVSDNNKIIGVGFETGKMERPKSKGSSGGGRGGKSGGGGKKMRGKGDGSGGSSPPSFDIWAKVYLAENMQKKNSSSIEYSKPGL